MERENNVTDFIWRNMHSVTVNKEYWHHVK